MDDIYVTVDDSIGPTNIGARKERNVRDHLLVINSIINKSVRDKTGNTEISIYDTEKCFDKRNSKSPEMICLKLVSLVIIFLQWQ